MNRESVGNGFFPFFIKIIIAVCIFGVFPVFLTLVVKNYNQQAEGIIQKHSDLEELHVSTEGDVRVLSEEDARVFEKVNQYAIGEWSNPLDPGYKVRFETDNSFNEFRGEKKIGYGLWRASVEKVAPEVTASSSSEVSSTTISSLEGYINTNQGSAYYILRTQYESGKKLDPVKYKIILLTNYKFSVALEDGSMINFERPQ
jgi:hypothetical protein